MTMRKKIAKDVSIFFSPENGSASDIYVELTVQFKNKKKKIVVASIPKSYDYQINVYKRTNKISDLPPNVERDIKEFRQLYKSLKRVNW